MALEITSTRIVEGHTIATLTDGREIGTKTGGNRWSGKMVEVRFVDIEQKLWGEHITARSGSSVKLALAEALEKLNNPPKVRKPRSKPTPPPAPKTRPVKELVGGEGFLWLGTSHRLLLVNDGPAIGCANPWKHQDWLRLRRDVATADTIIGWYEQQGLEYAREVVARWSPRLGRARRGCPRHSAVRRGVRLRWPCRADRGVLMPDTTNTLAEQLVAAVGRAAPCQHEGDDCDCAARNKDTVVAVLDLLEGASDEWMPPESQKPCFCGLARQIESLS